MLLKTISFISIAIVTIRLFMITNIVMVIYTVLVSTNGHPYRGYVAVFIFCTGEIGKIIIQPGTVDYQSMTSVTAVIAE